MNKKNTIFIIILVTVITFSLSFKAVNFFNKKEIVEKNTAVVINKPKQIINLVTSTPPIEVKPNITTSSIGIVKLTVQFVQQAPLLEWSDPRQQNGCEEASVFMAVHWARGEGFTKKEARDEIVALAEWQQEKYGGYVDTSAEDTVKRIFNEYYSFYKATVVKNITADDIIKELEKGNLVLVPANGRALKNKYFRLPGPTTHMVVIVGYDYGQAEFITNDVGTNKGKDYRYSRQVFFEAIRDYPTGDHEPIEGTPKNMIVVQK